MAESEPLDKNVKAAEKALAEEKKQVDAEKAQAREKTAADEKALGRVAGASHAQIAVGDQSCDSQRI